MVNQENSEIVRCNNCRTILNESPSIQYSERTPCPICGSLSRYCEKRGRVAKHYKIAINTALSVSIPRIGARGKRHGKGKPFIDQYSKRELFRESGEYHDVDRVIDRDNNLYIEIIKDSKTGKVLRHCWELLDYHVGHGYAKQKGDSKTD